MGLSDCGCESVPDYDYSKLATTQPCVTQVAEDVDCVSHEGKFYDVTTEEFVIPSVGKEFYIHLCQGNLWTKGVWIAVNLPNNKFAIFKITEAGNKRIKCLNGLDKSGDNGVTGNPDPGTTVASGSIFYPVIPAGSTSDFVTKIINAVETSGVDTIINILKESESICFTNTPEVDDADGDVHLFGGTKPDCDCSEGASVFSCFRKLLNIITGQSGKTLCMPEVATTSGEDVDGGQQKRMAVFDENGCLKKYIRLVDFDSCADLDAVTVDNQFSSLIVCDEGTKKVVAARKNYNIYPVPVDPDLPDGDYSWQMKPAGMQFFPLNSPQTILSSETSSSVTLNNFPHVGCYGIFEVNLRGEGTHGFTLTVDGQIIRKGKTDDALATGEPSDILPTLMPKLSTDTPTCSFASFGGAYTTISVTLKGYMAYYGG